MTDVVVAINAGSSSVKAAVAEAGGDKRVLLSGGADRLGADKAELTIRRPGADSETKPVGSADHAHAIRALFAEIAERRPDLSIKAVGHRIVHGGASFVDPALVTPQVVEALDALVPLAPLHQPHGLAGIRTASSLYPDARHVACFDTAFHAAKPWVHDAFALPARYYEQGVRRYGFHGLACESVCETLAAQAYPLADRKIAIAHLGNGCSVTAVCGGRSIASSMGFSALDGLVMGTRCGRIDPGVLLHLLRTGVDADGLERLLYRESGLLGLSGLSNDMRDLAQSDSEAAQGAIRYFVERVIEEVSRMAAAMRGLDAVVFSGGVGENAADIRDAVATGLDFLPGRDGAGIDILVHPADEEGRLMSAARRFLSRTSEEETGLP
ncbi:MAG: acetate/propionate family kinase [Marivibrio sp.]|uniref:acetate/propionate family kinase n=1 Tax=Marivibrio sp. TaxID=2039719 RepID=UPI0032EFC25B